MALLTELFPSPPLSCQRVKEACKLKQGMMQELLTGRIRLL